MNSDVSSKLLTADGTPLKVSLRRSLRRNKLRALGLILPAFLFLLFLFVLPIGNLLSRSVDDSLSNLQLPLTFGFFSNWDRETLPEEDLFHAMYLDLFTLNKFFIGNDKALNVDVTDPGWWIRIPEKGPYKPSITGINPAWNEIGTWQSLKEIVDEAALYKGSSAEQKIAKNRAQFDLCRELTTLPNASCKRLYASLMEWDGNSIPDESVFKSMYKDLASAHKILVGKSGTRMNYEQPGWKSLVRKSLRAFKKFDEPPYKEVMIKADERWGKIEFWHSLGAMKDTRTMGYYWNSLDRRFDVNKDVVMQPEERQVYVMLWGRTMLVSLYVTIFCLLLAYPTSHLLATLPLRYSNLLMICVLMPFWTSLLVRIVAWMVMLQQEGIINDTLVWANIISDENRLPMMFNFTGTVIVMVQILLPFMILPLYSVMKTIPPSYMRAAQNLGAPPWLAFVRVYIPQTLPGVGAGVILVFIVAIGYYITPELVGGKDGRLIGNMVAYHMQKSLNWGLAAAMGSLLLIAILLLYWVYDKVVGIDNMKLG